VGDLQSALSTAFDEAVAEPASSGNSVSEPEPEVRETPSEPSEQPTPEKAEESSDPEEESAEDGGFQPLSRDEVAQLKKENPKVYATYRRMAAAHTQRMQKFAEQGRLWDALNNPQTQKQAVEALARSVGLDIKPTDQPQRDQAAAVADSISDEWSKVVGPEAATLLRPLIEKTALAAVQGTLQPLQKASEYLQMDARSRQAEAQVSQFRASCQKNGWEITPDVEAKMAELGQQILPAKPIESVDQGVKHLERLYRLATADGAEAAIEKRILERMKKAEQSAEPARGVPSTGREKRTNITKEMNLNEAMDVAFQELGYTSR